MIFQTLDFYAFLDLCFFAKADHGERYQACPVYSSSCMAFSFSPQFCFSFPKQFQPLKKETKINERGLSVYEGDA